MDRINNTVHWLVHWPLAVICLSTNNCMVPPSSASLEFVALQHFAILNYLHYDFHSTYLFLAAVGLSN